MRPFMSFKYILGFETGQLVAYRTMNVHNCKIGDLLIATGFTGCHGVIVWAKNNQSAIMIHDTGPKGIDARDVLQGFLNSSGKDTFEGIITNYTHSFASQWLLQKKIKFHMKCMDNSRKYGSFIALKIGGPIISDIESLEKEKGNLIDGPEVNFDIKTKAKASSVNGLLKHLDKKNWNKNSNKCERCKKDFRANKTAGFGINFLRSGRHHCRDCGKCICENCCGKFASNKQWDATQANANVHIYCYTCLPQDYRRNPNVNSWLD